MFAPLSPHQYFKFDKGGMNFTKDHSYQGQVWNTRKTALVAICFYLKTKTKNNPPPQKKTPLKLDELLKQFLTTNNIIPLE